MTDQLRYTPGQPPQGNPTEEAIIQVYHELSEIAGVIGTLVDGRNQIYYAEPIRKARGQIVYADGTKWDPGQGEGLYSYDGTTWRRLAPTERGVGVPTLSFGGASVGIVYNFLTALQWTRIDRLIAFRLRMTLTNKGASVGAALINGLPYTANTLYPATQAFAQTVGAGNTGTPSYITGTSIQMLKLVGGASVVMTDADFLNGSDFIYGGVYAA